MLSTFVTDLNQQGQYEITCRARVAFFRGAGSWGYSPASGLEMPGPSCYGTRSGLK